MGLILSANPDLTMDQARLVLMMSADQINADKVNWESVIGSDVEEIFAYDDKGHSIGFGYGRVNAHKAASCSPLRHLYKAANVALNAMNAMI